MLKKVIINKIDGYNYYLLDNNGNIYIKNIEFISNYKPKVNDVIFLSESILNEVNLYSFIEVCNQDNIREEDIIKIVSEDNNYYYVRQYG